MQRTALERLPRGTDIFDSGIRPAQTGAVASGYYPPLPVAADRTDLPRVLRTLLWGWPVVDHLAARGAEEVRTRPFDGDAREAVYLMLSLENRAGSYNFEERRRLLVLLDEVVADAASSRAAGTAGGEGQVASVSGAGQAAPTSGLDAEDSELGRLVLGAEGSFTQTTRRYAQLPPLLRDMTNGGRLDLKTAERLSRYPTTASVLREVTAALSFSNRRRLTTMLWELAQRDGLDDEETAAVAREVAKQTDPVAALRLRRYPTLSSLEDRFHAVRERALGGSGVRLSPPPNFEGGGYAVEFAFTSREELRRRLRALQRLEEDADELFELL
ncbi:MAG: hypothetical protein ACLFMV_11230 [Spirochaetaceae bacterium]